MKKSFRSSPSTTSRLSSPILSTLTFTLQSISDNNKSIILILYAMRQWIECEWRRREKGEAKVMFLLSRYEFYSHFYLVPCCSHLSHVLMWTSHDWEAKTFCIFFLRNFPMSHSHSALFVICRFKDTNLSYLSSPFFWHL